MTHHTTYQNNKHFDTRIIAIRACVSTKPKYLKEI